MKTATILELFGALLGVVILAMFIWSIYDQQTCAEWKPSKNMICEIGSIGQRICAPEQVCVRRK